MSQSKLVVEFMDDGSVKLNASGMLGTEQKILGELQSLAGELGGELVVEKHVHSHTHTHGHSHSHKVGGK